MALERPGRTPSYIARVPVRWGDMDALGHVNNSRYFTYFEEVRIAWLQTLETEWSREVGPVLVSARCDYKRPITFPATLLIHLFADPPGRSSLKTHYDVYREDDPDVLCAVGEATIVWVDFAQGRPVSLPDVLRAALPRVDD